MASTHQPPPSPCLPQSCNNSMVAQVQAPGDFFVFWNFLVPSSIFLNVVHFGARRHEMMLFLALFLGSFAMSRIYKNQVIAWVFLLFIIGTVERMVKRWPFYRIYSSSFLYNAVVLGFFLSVPDIVIYYWWNFVCHGLQSAIKKSNSQLAPEQVLGYRNSILTAGSFLMLLHSIYIWRSYACQEDVDEVGERCLKTRCERKPCFRDSFDRVTYCINKILF